MSDGKEQAGQAAETMSFLMGRTIGAIIRKVGEVGPYKRWTLLRSWLRRESNLDQIREEDAEKNTNGRLPADEEADLPAIWLVELYTPSTVNGLFEGVRKLGWEKGRTGSHDLLEWMDKVRAGRRAGWMSLGFVTNPDDRQLMRERSALLPAGVKAAFPAVMSISPSITALSFCFILNEQESLSVSAVLKSDFDTQIERMSRLKMLDVVRYIIFGGEIGLGHKILDPESARRELAQKKLRDIEIECQRWVAKWLPGAFSSLHGASMPTAFLFLTKNVVPLSEEAREVRALDAIGVGYRHEVWRSSEWVEGRVTLPYSTFDVAHRIIFCCRRKDAFPAGSGYFEPESNFTIAQRADEYIQGVLVRRSLSGLLDAYHEFISTLRDRWARDGGYKTIRDLKRLRSLVRTTKYDIEACSQEIIDLGGREQRYRIGSSDLYLLRGDGRSRISLFEGLRSSQTRRAGQVKRDSELLHSMLITSNEISQTIANIRIQFVVIVLAVVSIGVAVWAAIISLKA